MYNFGAGLPDPRSIPIAGLIEATQRILPQLGESLAQYPGGKGYLPLRELSARRFTQREGYAVSPEQVLITNGSMQALNLIAQTHTQPGDTVIIEEHCYSGSLGVFRKFGLNLEGVPLDGDGLLVDAVEARVRNCLNDHRKPKFIYTIASHQNPTGSVLPLQRRRQLIKIANAYDIPLIEDHCYADVRFETIAPSPQPSPARGRGGTDCNSPLPLAGEGLGVRGEWYQADVPSFFTLEPTDRVTYLGSYSKILGPGVRLGFVIGTESSINQLLMWKMDGGISALTTMIVTEYFQGRLWEHVAAVNRVLKAKRDATLEALEENFGDWGERTEAPGNNGWVQFGEVGWSRPPGGFFIWMKVPEATDMDRLRALAAERELQIASGKSFDAANNDIRYVRLAFGFPALDQIPAGISLLRECVEGVQVGASISV